MIDLQLSVPELLTYDNPLAECNPRKVAVMVSELPLMNPVASVNSLLNALQPLNQQAMPDKDRLRLLEQYREPVRGLFNAFDGRGMRLVAVSPAQRRQLVTDVGRLCQALADGYKLVVTHGHASGQDPSRDQDLLLATARAMEQLGYVLIHCFRTYVPVAKHVYQELHHLYRYAEAHQVLNADLPGGRRIAEMYRCLMLTAVADPAHMQEGIVLGLFQMLPDYAGHCRVQPGRGMDPPDGCFVIDLTADAPPIPCARVSPKAALGDPRVMDARDIVKVLQAKLHADAGAEEEAQLDTERRILQPLLGQLASTPVRRSERERVRQPVSVAVGIPAIHHFLSPGGAQRAQRQADSRHLGIEVIEGAEDESRAYYRLQEWLVLDQSEQGYRLQFEGGNGDIRVGELLGIGVGNLGSGPTQLRLNIGVVRWLRHPSGSLREVGVELIPGVAAPVNCHPLGETAQFIDQRVGLFLPSQNQPKLSATLLTPKKIYARGRRLRVDVGQKPLTVEAGHLVMDTACFDRFTFLSTRES